MRGVKAMGAAAQRRARDVAEKEGRWETHGLRVTWQEGGRGAALHQSAAPRPLGSWFLVCVRPGWKPRVPHCGWMSELCSHSQRQEDSLWPLQWQG